MQNLIPSEHAIQRMNQRGIGREAVELILEYGTSRERHGAQVILLDKKTLMYLRSNGLANKQLIDKCANTYLVVDGCQLLTCAHKTKSFKRDSWIH